MLPTAFGDTFHNLGSRRLRVALASFWLARSDVSCVLGSVNPLAVLASLACRRNRGDLGPYVSNLERETPDTFVTQRAAGTLNR
jgi:hypothetical protein